MTNDIADGWSDEQLRERAEFMGRDWPVLNADQQRLLATEIYSILRHYLGIERQRHERTIAELQGEIEQRNERLMILTRAPDSMEAQLDAQREIALEWQRLTREAIERYEALEKQIAVLRQQLDDARQWEDVEYNDIINVDNNNQLRVVINCDNPDGKVHLHIRKRVNGEWRHAGITTLLSNYRLQRRKAGGDE